MLGTLLPAAVDFPGIAISTANVATGVRARHTKPCFLELLENENRLAAYLTLIHSSVGIAGVVKMESFSDGN